MLGESIKDLDKSDLILFLSFILSFLILILGLFFFIFDEFKLMVVFKWEFEIILSSLILLSLFFSSWFKKFLFLFADFLEVLFPFSFLLSLSLSSRSFLKEEFSFSPSFSRLLKGSISSLMILSVPSK